MARRNRSRAVSVSETSEQAWVVRTLRRSRVLVYAVPNGARRSPAEQQRFLAEGGLTGVSDLVLPEEDPLTHRERVQAVEQALGALLALVQPTHARAAEVFAGEILALTKALAGGIFLEMKKTQGGRESDEQKAFRARAEALNWTCLVAKGSREALDKLRKRGVDAW